MVLVLRDLVSSKQENYFLFFSRLLLTIILYSKKYLHVWGKKIVCAAMNDINSTLVLLISCFWFLYTNFTTTIKSIGRHCFFNLCVLFYMILTKPTLRAFIDLNHLQHVSLFVLCADCVLHGTNVYFTTMHPITNIIIEIIGMFAK